MTLSISAKVIADSIAPHGICITTLELCYPRFIHGEVMTHRVFSRNAMSSRAIPVAKMIEQVRNDPAMPIHWGKNQPGMQAHVELTGEERLRAIGRWKLAAEAAANHAEVMLEIGAHKQVVNRLLEPFQWMRTIVTSTHWKNFFELRDHPDAQPEFGALARAMKDAMNASTPVERPPVDDPDMDPTDAWHLPYVTVGERAAYDIEYLLKMSTARCARVSYLTHDGLIPDIGKDIELYDRLVGSRPIHASPCEHQAVPEAYPDTKSGNFTGWTQHRQLIEKSLTC
jgi:thymidylate synthase ThyX